MEKLQVAEANATPFPSLVTVTVLVREGSMRSPGTTSCALPWYWSGSNATTRFSGGASIVITSRTPSAPSCSRYFTSA